MTNLSEFFNFTTGDNEGAAAMDSFPQINEMKYTTYPIQLKRTY